MPSQYDYAGKGLTIQSAMLDHYKRYLGQNERPDHILWGGLAIKTGDTLPVHRMGVVRGEFLSSRADIEQGFDINVDGWITLPGSRQVKSLRTWKDPRCPCVVEYPFRSNDGLLRVWNVYKMKYPGLQVVEEKWTGNAGFWIEEVNKTERIYHCSHGSANPPDFTCLVFKITII